MAIVSLLNAVTDSTSPFPDQGRIEMQNNQDKQEPKNPYPAPIPFVYDHPLSAREVNIIYESQKVPVAQYDAWEKCATAYQPLLAALQQRIKELEDKYEQVCADNLQRGNRISVYEQQIADLNESLDDLESQLKPVSGWEETVKYHCICRTKDSVDKHNLVCIDYNKGRSEQAKITWRKALASQKGETK